MRILLNATSVRLGGGITVIRNLLPALIASDGGRHDYVVACRSDVAEAIDPAHPRVRLETRVASEHWPFQRPWWEQVGLPSRCLGREVDLVFSPAGIAILACPVPQVLMFQNMAPFEPAVVERATGLKRIRLNLLRWLGRLSAHRADKVVFISEYARTGTLPQLGVESAKTALLHLGRDTRFQPRALHDPLPAQSADEADHPYLLSVSQFYHYKNFVELVTGFARALPDLPPEVALVIAGAEHEVDYANQVRRTIKDLGLAERVRLLGQVPYEALPALYARASLFIFPSTCESFPNILIEALSSGVPTLASRLGPMPELAREGAAYFDPFNPDEIASAIVRTWNDRAGAAAMARRGLEIADGYSWEATAASLLNIFEQAVAAPDVAKARVGPRSRPAPQGRLSPVGQSQKVEAFFDVKATPWSEKYRGGGVLTARLDRFMRAVGTGTPTQRDILDIGCGTGALASSLASTGNRVTGCDISGRMLDEARATHGGTVSWMKLEPAWTRLPFGDGGFDIVVASSVLEYVDDLETFAGEVARVLRRGGLLIATVPNVASAIRRAEAVAAVLLRVVGARHWKVLPRIQRFAEYLILSRNRGPERWWTELLARHGLDLVRSDASDPLTMMTFRRRQDAPGIGHAAPAVN